MQDEFESENRIVALHPEEAEDQAVDPIMRICVLYVADDNRLVPDKVVAVVGPLRNRISQTTNGLDRFPILAFMIQVEAGLATS
ncbi:MAG: hypothetical protein OXC57_12900 [Rhodobacteraceae bacterium]|nr:hypothetical protein [Paracoccaceae bacterium]